MSDPTAAQDVHVGDVVQHEGMATDAGGEWLKDCKVTKSARTDSGGWLIEWRMVEDETVRGSLLVRPDTQIQVITKHQGGENPASPVESDQGDVAELLAGLDLEITPTDNPPRKTAPKVPRKPSVFDDALKDSAETGEWQRSKVPTRLIKVARFEVIRAARSLDMKVKTRTGTVEQSITDEEEKTGLFFLATWKED